MAGETGTSETDEPTEMRSTRDSTGLLRSLAPAWIGTVLWFALLLLSLWLNTAGPVDEVLFGFLTVLTAVYAVGKTLNELGVISV